MTTQPLHALHGRLIELGVCAGGSLVPYAPRVRDRGDVAAFRCAKSGVVLLSRVDHITAATYEHEDFQYWRCADRDAALQVCRRDDERRAALLKPLLAGRRWLDVGTGVGGVLDLAGPCAAQVSAIELQPAARAALTRCGYTMYARLADVAPASQDVVTAFHVVEHMADAVAELQRMRAVLRPGGRVIIEVPHANDALLTHYGSEAFKAFTLWSEHLLLHTRGSLAAICRAAGFPSVRIEAVQRYPLSNHLYWLSQGKPGGHEHWAHLSDPLLDRAYEARLAALDATDTLMAYAS